jgi:hypothetical protein
MKQSTEDGVQKAETLMSTSKKREKGSLKQQCNVSKTILIKDIKLICVNCVQEIRIQLQI